MLEPRDRQLMFDALKPPVGYRFDQGLGTTYSMDLLALMMAPVAFTFFDQKQSEDGPAHTSLEVLEGLRRYADRVTVFCEAGRIAVPHGRYPQLAFVEQSVVQCRPPQGGSFHPKLWVLRYLGEGPVKYRVLCLSRNLMFCRAWDTMLTLDGDVKTRTVAANRPLASFVEALPSFGDDTPTAVGERAALFGQELLTTEFQLPDGLSSIRFWPLGLPGRRSQPFREIGKRLLIVSPFVGLTALEGLAQDTVECDVVSTIPQLGCLSRRPKGVKRFFVLNERAVTESEDTAAALSEPMADAIAQGDLHAKLYVTELGAEAHIFTGSVNATDAALNRNVEFMVELIGPRKQFGIDTLMAPEKDQVRLINLIRDVTEGDVVAGEPVNEALETLERRLDACRTALVEARLKATVTKRDDGAFQIAVSSETGLVIPGEVAAGCWPASTDSLKQNFSICEPRETLVEFPVVSFEAITSFFAFEITGRIPEGERHLRFVLNLPLIGAPADRRDRVLRSILADRGRFLKFIMLLLADEGFDPGAMGDALNADGSNRDDGGNASASGLLEMLLHALDSAPTRLDHLESLLRQLTSDEEGRSLLPAGFDAIWKPIWAHRQKLRTSSESHVQA